MVAVVMFLLTLRMLYLEVLKIKNKMKFTKVGYGDSFAYGFYFLATLALILGVYFKNLDTLKLGMFLHIFGSSLINLGNLYYDDKILILGSSIVNTENISNVEMENKSIFIKYKNGLNRKITFLSKLVTQNIYNFLKKS